MSVRDRYFTNFMPQTDVPMSDKEVERGVSREDASLLPAHPSDVDQVESGTYTYEGAIKACGYGRFHWLLLLACGWANAGDAVEVLCTSFLLPSAECDLQLTSSDKGLMNAMIFVGMMFGGYIWGSLADTYGRKSMLFTSLVFNGVFGILSSFAQSFSLFLCLRFLSGVGVGGNIPTVWSYFAEFQPKHKRGGMLSFLATFWMVGNILTAGLAWAIIPRRELDYYSDTFSFGSWRVFVALTAVPCLTAAAAISLLPESPKFLMDSGKEGKALSTLQYIHEVNHPHLPRPSFPVRSLVGAGETYNRMSHMPFSLVRVKLLLVKMFSQTKELFVRHRRSTALLVWISFTLSFGYYGLWLWFPELYKRMEKLSDLGITDISVCSDAVSNISSTPEINCSGELVNSQDSYYLEAFLLAASNLPGNIFTIACMDRLGRKVLMALSMTVCGASVFFIYFVSTRVHNIILSCIFGGVSVITWNTLDCLGVELFPTNVRSTALGVNLVAARIGAILGNIVFGQLIDSNCAVPIMMVAILLISGGLSGCLLPNTTQIELL